MSTLPVTDNQSGQDIIWRKLSHQRIDGVVPGVRGQRVFPTAELTHADPFVLLDHIGPQIVDGDYKVDGHMHPHRGFETITFMFAGNLHHKDNFGHRVLLTSGGVQQMNAGRGISHGGDMWGDEASGEFHEIQLWVNSPARQKMSEPKVNSFDTSQIPVIKRDGLDLRIIAGSHTDAQGTIVTGPVKTFAHISAYHGLGKSVDDTININPEHDRILIYVLKGDIQLTLNGKLEKLQAFESLLIENNPLAQITLAAIDGEFLFLSGRSIGEPIVMGGPFVMNTEQEILTAQQDHQNGYFD